MWGKYKFLLHFNRVNTADNFERNFASGLIKAEIYTFSWVQKKFQ